MKLMLMAVMLFCSVANFALAEEPKKVPVKEGYGTLDMSDYNKHAQSEASANKAKVTVTTSCTDTIGKEHKQGDSGYDSCLINSKNPVEAGKTNPQMNVKFGSDSK